MKVLLRANADDALDDYAFQRLPDVVDFLEQAVRDVGDKVPTVTDVLDQPFLPQPLQRAFDVQAADAVLCRQRDLAQPVPRGKIAVQDPLFQFII